MECWFVRRGCGGRCGSLFLRGGWCEGPNCPIGLLPLRFTLGTMSPKYVMEIFYNYSTVSFRIWGKQEGADEIEKELDGALPCWDDMVRAERLQD